MGRVRRGRSKSRCKEANSGPMGGHSGPAQSPALAVTRSATCNPLTPRRIVNASHQRILFQGDQNAFTANVQQQHGYPPPFDQAISQHLASSPSRNHSNSSDPYPRSPSVLSLSSEESPCSTCDTGPTAPPAQLSGWELDLRAGFTLQERVKREWERANAQKIPIPILIPDHSSGTSTRAPLSSHSTNYPTRDDPFKFQFNSEDRPIVSITDEVDCQFIHQRTDPLSVTLCPDQFSRNKRRPKAPTPPPPLPHSYISTRDRMPHIERSQNVAQTGSDPINRRRTPPPIPPRKPRGDSESTKPAQLSSTPRSACALSCQGGITQPQACENTATNDADVLKAFDPLGSLTCRPDPPTTDCDKPFLDLASLDMSSSSSNRPLPPHPTPPPLSVVTAFDELRQRRRAASVMNPSHPHLVPIAEGGSSSGRPLSPHPASASRIRPATRPRRRGSVLSVANPSPESEEEEGEITTEALLQRNHQLRTPPTLPSHDITDLDVMVSRLSMQDGPSQGNDYESLLVLGEVMGNARPPPDPYGAVQSLSIGKVVEQRRRITESGRVRLKMNLLGVSVDRCSICFSQFRADQLAALLPNCTHCFHDKCIIGWVKRTPLCPVCRAPVRPS